MTRSRSMRRPRPPARGHTLLELLVALAIVATLTVLAQASYSRFVLGARRLDARLALADVAAAQERHYLRYARYAEQLLDDASRVSTVRPLGPDDTTLPVAGTSPQSYYRIAIVAADEEGYRLEARPLGGQMQDRVCALFVLEATGRRTAQDSSGADSSRRCWSGA